MKTRRRSGQRGPTSASTPSANAVSVDIAAPQPCAPTPPRVEREVDQHRHRHAADAGEHGQRDAPALAQLAHVELAPRLEADDEEEERHQAVVDPVAQVLGERRVAERDREVGRPERVVGRVATFAQTSAAIVGGEQDDRAAGLGAQERAHRRGLGPRPGRAAGKRLRAPRVSCGSIVQRART